MPIITNMASSYVEAHKNVMTAESPKPTLWCSGKGDKGMEREKKTKKMSEEKEGGGPREKRMKS